MLNHRVKIVVPSTVNVDEVADTSAQVEAVATKLSRLFGGCTVRDANGYWLSDTAGLVVEAVKEVESLTESLTDEQIDEVVKIAVDLKEELQQESVLYEIDSIGYFTE